MFEKQIAEANVGHVSIDWALVQWVFSQKKDFRVKLCDILYIFMVLLLISESCFCQKTKQKSWLSFKPSQALQKLVLVTYFQIYAKFSFNVGSEIISNISYDSKSPMNLHTKSVSTTTLANNYIQHL